MHHGKKDRLIVRYSSVSIFVCFLAATPVFADCMKANNQREAVRCLQEQIDELTSSLREEIQQGRTVPRRTVPKGAVIAFNDDQCPKGWKKFKNAAGRVIVGVGKSTRSGKYYLNQEGGNETQGLRIENLPSHNHPVIDPGHLHKSQYMGSPSGKDHGWWGKNGGYSGWDTSTAKTNISMGNTGSNKEFNIMQPWIALTYCEKQ